MTREGLVLCYPCADAQCIAEWNETKVGEGFIGYLSVNCREVQTWTGATLAKVTRRSVSQRFAPTGGRYEWHSIRARDAAGREWYGGGPGGGMYCRLRPRKSGRCPICKRALSSATCPKCTPLAHLTVRPLHCPQCANSIGVAIPARGTCKH